MDSNSTSYRWAYRDTALIRKRPPPQEMIGPEAEAYCRVIGSGACLSARNPVIRNALDLLLLAIQGMGAQGLLAITDTHRPRVLLCRGTSLIRNTPLLGPCSRTVPRVLWWSYGGGLFLMSEVPL